MYLHFNTCTNNFKIGGVASSWLISLPNYWVKIIYFIIKICQLISLKALKMAILTNIFK